jgi:hypothetical protein
MARVRLSATARSVLQLLALCPDIPADVVAVLTGDRHHVSIQQLLRRLEEASLVRKRQVPISPILGFRRAALWSLTAAGTAQLLTQDDDVSAKSDASLQPPLSVRLSRPSLRLASAWMRRP